MDELFKKEMEAYANQLQRMSLKVQCELMDLRLQILRYIDHAHKQMVEQKTTVKACSINSIASGHDDEVILTVLQDIQAAIPGLWIDYRKERPTVLLIHLRS